MSFSCDVLMKVIQVVETGAESDLALFELFASGETTSTVK